MVRKAIIVKASKGKYTVRNYSICLYCGRRRGKFRPFNHNRASQSPICRLDFLKKAGKGELPGYNKKN